MQTLNLVIFNKHISVLCQHAKIYEVLKTIYHAFVIEKAGSRYPDADLCFEAGFDPQSGNYSLQEEQHTPRHTNSAGEFLYWFEKEITIKLQRLRQDLFFLHAAALQHRQNAFILTGPPGAGKSTLSWALLHHGFGYLSDEMAPLDPATLAVQPYPHALCLKSEPPPPYGYPDNTVATRRAHHIPTSIASIRLVRQPLKISMVFFTRYSPHNKRPFIRRIEKPEAALRLYPNALNPLAHNKAGLEMVTKVVENTPCYELMTAALDDSVTLIEEVLENHHAG